MKSVCEKVVYEGLLVILMFLKVNFFKFLVYLFQCKKNVLESTDGPYPQLTLQRWGREGVQQSLRA